MVNIKSTHYHFHTQEFFEKNSALKKRDYKKYEIQSLKRGTKNKPEGGFKVGS